MIRSTRAPFALAILLLSGCLSIERLAIPKSALLDARYETAGSTQDVDHAAWSDFLARYAELDNDGVRRIAYGSVDEQARADLAAYTQRLQSLDPSALARNSQLAYWVNLYNAKTVEVILEHYPVKSIRSIRDSPIDPGPWENARLEVNGERLSLHDIEHGIVRPLWPGTPEIHYLLNCAATGCPNLGAAAYTGADIEAALNAAARSFVNDPRGVVVLPDGRLQVSKIYAWYRKDFGATTEDVLAHLRRYAAPELRAQLEDRTRIDRYAYDWSLNDSSSP
ncbi:MAG: DUF547 domain-containing protein [Pseudomonadota bacterium]